MIRKKNPLQAKLLYAQSIPELGMGKDSEETLAPPTFLTAAVTVAILGAHQ